MENKALNLIGCKEYQYNQNITLKIPLVKQIRNVQNTNVDFWREVNLFTTTPSDMISELDSNGIDFETINDYVLFLWLFASYQADLKSKVENGIVYDDILFSTFKLHELNIKSVEDGEDFRIILVNNDDIEIINEIVYDELSLIIADITGRKKTPPKKFGNDYAKKMRIKQDYKNKEKARQESNKYKSDVLGGIILRLVCNTNFPYNFETIQDITIYDLLYSLKQIEKDIQVSDLMQSRLVGNDLTKLPREDLSRFIL